MNLDAKIGRRGELSRFYVVRCFKCGNEIVFFNLPTDKKRGGHLMDRSMVQRTVLDMGWIRKDEKWQHRVCPESE